MEPAASGRPSAERGWTPGKAAALLAVVALVWLAFDRITKVHFDAYALGEDIAGPFKRNFQFTQVTKKGSA